MMRAAGTKRLGEYGGLGLFIYAVWFSGWYARRGAHVESRWNLVDDADRGVQTSCYWLLG